MNVTAFDDVFNDYRHLYERRRAERLQCAGSRGRLAQKNEREHQTRYLVAVPRHACRSVFALNQKPAKSINNLISAWPIPVRNSDPDAALMVG